MVNSVKKDGNEEKRQYRLLVTLTKQEYELLERVHKMNGRPMATIFMEVVREMKWLGFAQKCFWVAEKILKIKDNIFSEDKKHSLFVNSDLFKR